METFYHGTTKLFDKFSLTHVLEGAGKVKFGYGVYLTSSYNSAAHYSFGNGEKNYVYTVEIPDLTQDNFIAFGKPILKHLVEKAENLIGKPLSEKHINDGKEFRKLLANHFDKKNTLEGEKQASKWLNENGIEYIIWPYNWKKGYEGETNRAVLDQNKVKIIKIEEITLDEKKKLKEIIGEVKNVKRLD